MKIRKDEGNFWYYSEVNRWIMLFKQRFDDKLLKNNKKIFERRHL